MNEEAIDIMYKVAIDEGYRKSKSDFLKLMGEDFDALRTMFENAKDNGYTKTIDEFAKLMGVETLPEKKKTQTSALRILLRKMVHRNSSRLVNPSL